MERTFAIIKPNAFEDGNSGKILSRIYQEGFKVVGLKKLYLSKVEAEGFYHVHRERPFFGELTEFMASGPCVVMVLEAESAIKKWRDLMGATNPAEAAEGTLRKEFAQQAALLHSVSPLATLGRGYSITRKYDQNTGDHQVIRNSCEVSAGDRVNVLLHAGEIDCQVMDKTAVKK